MRIAILNWTRLHTGGAETYLGDIIPELLARGHAVGFWHENNEPDEWARIALPDSVPTWCPAIRGVEPALAALRDWRPDLIYTHVTTDVETEARLLALAPAVYFAHGHGGMCISGTKTMQFPTPTPCSRQFGWPCLLCYYPRRCGGLNPLTMWRDYRQQKNRHALLRKYAAIVVASEYLKQEFLKHGLLPERVHRLPMSVHGADGPATTGLATHHLPPTTSGANAASSPWRLLYVGRMDWLKGGGLLLKALPEVVAALRRPVHVTFAGDGPERAGWEQEGARLHAQYPDVSVEFLGWQDQAQVGGLYRRHDLIVVPSILPETFGLVGVEAGLSGMPAAAFAVGGITSWLTDGVNGHVAPGNPATATGLAQAIVKCLADPAHHARLGRGAAQVARRFTLEAHLDGLLRVFASVCPAPARVPIGP